MTVPTRTPLGASTVNRKWYVDVDIDDDGTPNWVGIHGITECQPSHENGLQDDSDFDSEGFGSQTKTREGWGLNLTVRRGVQSATPTAYDPGQEFLRTKSIGKMGTANSVHIRYYEMEPGGPRAEAYEGRAAVGWSPNGGGMDALSTVAITLAGQGKLTAITHPDA